MQIKARNLLRLPVSAAAGSRCSSSSSNARQTTSNGIHGAHTAVCVCVVNSAHPYKVTSSSIIGRQPPSFTRKSLKDWYSWPVGLSQIYAGQFHVQPATNENDGSHHVHACHTHGAIMTSTYYSLISSSRNQQCKSRSCRRQGSKTEAHHIIDVFHVCSCPDQA